MSFLVIGTGAIGMRHANNLKELGESVVAVSMQQQGLSGVEKAFQQGVEAAIICTATQLRLPLIKLAAKYNTPVYIEKPVSFTLSELLEVHQTLGALAGKSFVGFMMRYHPAVQYLARLKDKDTYRFSFEIGHDVHQWRANWSFADSYASDENGGGVLLDLCHELDMAYVVLGALDIHTVQSVAHPDFPQVDFNTQISLSNDHSSGIVAMDYISPISKRITHLMGQGANIIFDFAKDCYRIERPTGVETLELSIDRQVMFQDTMADFINLVRGNPLNNEFAPIFANELDICKLICEAYEKRAFTSVLKVSS